MVTGKKTKQNKKKTCTTEILTHTTMGREKYVQTLRNCSI